MIQNYLRRGFRLEPVVSALTEIGKRIQELTDIQGTNSEYQDFITFHIDDSILSSEQFKLARMVNDKSYLNFFAKHHVTNWSRAHLARKDQITTNRASFIDLQVELTNYVFEQGDWAATLPKDLGNLQKSLMLQAKQGRIPASLAVEMIKLAYEAGNREILDYFSTHYDGYLREMVDPEKSISVDLAVELVKLARERGDRNALDYFEPYLHRKLKERNEVPTALVFEVIKLVREVNDRYTLNDFLERYVQAIMAARSIPVVLLVELVKITDVSSNQAMLRKLMDYCENIIRENRYIPHELAIAMIKLARKADDRNIMNYLSGDYLRDVLQAQQLVPVELAVELIKLVQESHTYDQVGIKDFYHKYIGAERCYLDLLTVDTLFDLQQLAQDFHDDELLRKIELVLRL